MRELEKPVARVYRRLRYQRFLAALVWSWAIGLAIVAGVIGGEKLLNRFLPVADWVPFAVPGGLGVLAAGVVAAFSGPSRMDAAVAIDRVFHLNERLSSALTLPGELRESPAGTALIADAIRKVTDLDVTAEFGLRMPRRAWVVLIPAAASMLMLFAPAIVPAIVRAKNAEPVDTKAIAKQAQVLSKKIASQRQAIDKEKFPEADKLLASIQKKSDELAKAPPSAKDKLMVELNTLTDALKDRQKQLGSPDQVNRQLQHLKDMASQGPADEFAKELARGDFQKATKELQKLKEKMESGKMTEAEKKALKEQIGEMAKKLNQLANLEGAQRSNWRRPARTAASASSSSSARGWRSSTSRPSGPQTTPAARQQAEQGAGGHGEGRHEAGGRPDGDVAGAARPDGQAARGDAGARRRDGRTPGGQERRREHGRHVNQLGDDLSNALQVGTWAGGRATARTAAIVAGAKATAPRPPTTPPPTRPR